VFDSPVVHAHNILTTDCKSWFLNLCNIPLIWLCTSHSAIQPLACNPRVTQQLDGCACLPYGLRYELLKRHARRAQVLLVRHGMQTLLHLISQGTQGVTSQRCEGSQEGCRTAKVCRTSTGRVAPEKSNAKANGTAPRPKDGMQAIVKQVPLNDRTTSTSAA